MIYCPKCGTANRDGSKFCNSCGEQLGTQTRIKCPECGAMNPVHNVLCTECRGRLLPSPTLTPDTETSPTIKGLSLPTKAPLDERKDDEAEASMPGPDPEVPAWLHELGATLTEEDQASGTESLDDASEIPDWLRDLRASLPEDSEAETDRTGQEEEKPDWLAELRSTAGAEEPETAPHQSEPAAEETELEAADEELPEWLARLRPAVEERETGTVPPQPEFSAEETDLEATEGEIPEWLARLRTPAEETESEPQATPRPSIPEAEATGPEAVDEEMPEWADEFRPAVEGAEAEASSPAPEADEVPDWLAELRATALDADSEPAPDDSEPQGEELPDWLAEPEPQAEEAEPLGESVTPGPEAEGEEFPDWLAEPEPQAEEAEPMPEPIAPSPEAEGDEFPDWLAEPEPQAEEAEPAAPDLQAEEAEIPDWLAALRPAVPEDELEQEALELEAGEEEAPQAMEAEPEPASFAPDAEEEELPGWLAEFQPEGEADEPETLPAALEPEVESAAEPPVGEIEGEEEPTAETPEDQEIALATAAAAAAAATVVPDLLAAAEEEPVDDTPPSAEERPVEGEVEAAEAAPVPEELVLEAEPAEVPDWLAAIEIEVEEATPPSGEEMLVELEGPDWPPSPLPDWEEEDALAPAEIPSWLLALKPTELRKEEDTDLTGSFEEPGDATGLLAGLSGILPVEMLIAQPRAATETARPDASLSDSPQARMFAEVVGQPPTAVPKEIAPEPTRVLAEVPRWIIYIVLIVAVTIPLLLEKPLLPHAIESTPAEEDLYATIEALTSNAPVLVAFDYDPTTSGEMDVVAEALVGHLMDRGVRVVTMSLLPAGPATAQSLVDKLAAEQPDYTDGYGQRYANLGYLPGQATAVRLVSLSLETAFPHDYYGTPLSELPVMEGLSNSLDFDLVIELAPGQDSLRWWVEQAATPYDIPLGAGVSASVAPLARPYYETEQEQLVGMVAGVPGATSYEALRSGQGGLPDPLAARLDSLLAGYAILILVLLVGNAVYLVRRGAGREH